jgi:DNA polymerase III subunit delta'
MMFEQIIGNEPAKRYLTSTASKGTMGNSLLFAGPEGIGKALFAEAFAKLLIGRDNPQQLQKIDTGNHPDLHIYRPEGKIGMHSIDAMRAFSEQVYLSPFEARWKFFIILEAERMLPYSANALLKTFEEPAQDAIIILLSSSPSSLLPTVRSRCRTIHFHPLTQAQVMHYLISSHQKSREEAQLIAGLARGSIGQALRLMREGAHPLRKQLLDFLAEGNRLAYPAIADAASGLAEQIESAKSAMEEQLRSTMLHANKETLTAMQKQEIEKEIEGAASMKGLKEMYFLFEALFSWYRDMHLLALNGERAYLFNPDYSAACLKALEQGRILPLEEVEAALSDARTAVERSGSFQICLEDLFLKLAITRL